MFNQQKAVAVFSQNRQGLATVELLIALPLIVLAYATLMFLSYGSHVKNDDHQAKYLALMDRHSDKSSRENKSQTKALKRESEDTETSSNHTELERENSNLTAGVIADIFPPTEDWMTTTSQELRYLPDILPTKFKSTTALRGMIFRGTGDPRNRPLGIASPSKDKVKQLAMSNAATLLGDKLGINFDQVKEFQKLLTGLNSVAQFAGDLAGEKKKLQSTASREIEKLKQQIASKEAEIEMKLKPSVEALLEELASAEPSEQSALETRINTVEDQVKAFETQIENRKGQIRTIKETLSSFNEAYH